MLMAAKVKINYPDAETIFLSRKAYQASSNEVNGPWLVHSTPIIQHIADTCGTIHKSHIILTSLRCCRVTVIKTILFISIKSVTI